VYLCKIHLRGVLLGRFFLDAPFLDDTLLFLVLLRWSNKNGIPPRFFTRLLVPLFFLWQDTRPAHGAAHHLSLTVERPVIAAGCEVCWMMMLVLGGWAEEAITDPPRIDTQSWSVLHGVA